MFVTKIKAALVVILILGFAATGATFFASRTAAGQDDEKPTAKKPVEPAVKQEKEKDKEAVTAWGKEVGGLQAGLGFRPDKAALQGTWQVVSIEREGKEQQVGEGREPAEKKERWVIKGNQITSKSDGSYPLSGMFTVRLGKTPKEIDINPSSEAVGPGAVIKGIYTLEGDVWKICLRGICTEGRPEEMRTKKGRKVVLITLKRVKPEQAGDKKPAEGKKDEGVKPPEAKADEFGWQDRQREWVFRYPPPHYSTGKLELEVKEPEKKQEK